MKTLKIFIEKDRIYREVARTTAYLGAKGALAAANGEIFDRLATDVGDQPLLGAYVDEAVAALVRRLKGVVTALEVTPDAVAVTFSLSGSYDDAMTPAVEQGVEAYLGAAVTASWLRMADPAKEVRWLEEAQTKAEGIIAAVYYRKAPKRKFTKTIT